jgi:hypothetical protein
MAQPLMFMMMMMMIKTVWIYLSCYAATLPRISCNNSGFINLLAQTVLFPVDVKSVPCVVSHVTSSHYAIVFERVAPNFALALGTEGNPSATNSPDMIRIILC